MYLNYRTVLNYQERQISTKPRKPTSTDSQDRLHILQEDYT